MYFRCLLFEEMIPSGVYEGYLFRYNDQRVTNLILLFITIVHKCSYCYKDVEWQLCGYKCYTNLAIQVISSSKWLKSLHKFRANSLQRIDGSS